MTSKLKSELCNELLENNLVDEGDMIYHSYTNNRLNGVRDINTTQNKDKNISAALTTRPDTLGIVVNDKPRLVGGVGTMKSNNGTQFYQQDRIYDSEEIALCQSANESFNPWYQVEEKEIDKPVNKRLIDTINDNGLDEDVSYIDAYNRKVEKNGTTGTITARINDNNKFISKNLRIRKLTPKECIRLMGFSDQDYMAMAKVNSDSQIYKQAGNSIVVNVLEAIFKEML